MSTATITSPESASSAAAKAGNANFGFADVERVDDATRELTYLAAISEALREEMARDPNVLVMGEDVQGPFGGAFKVTKGLSEEFGPKRVLNMPMAELGFVGAATGMALMGLRPVIEMQFADFITSAFDSIVQYAATNHYRWGAPIPWVIRAPSDGGLRSGPFHSQNPEAWFVHAPGLKVVAPATPADAKGLLLAAIRDNNPVIYLEAKPLYRTLKAYVPPGEYVVPIGQAHTARAGEHVSIITYGAQVHQALAAAARLAQEGIECEVLDLRTLKPLDEAAILAAARKTGKVLIAHSATRLVGVGAEVAALISEQAFEWLDAPIARLGGLDVPVPFSPPLEDAYRPNAEKIYRLALDLARF
jgi:2-oxoisovalerate dehydrogenase E1 component beta subunit